MYISLMEQVTVSELDFNKYSQAKAVLYLDTTEYSAVNRMKLLVTSQAYP